MKKFLVSLMAVLLILPVLLNTTAQASSLGKQTSEFTMEDVMALESYISVENGLFKFDSSSATKNGHDKELVKMQKDYLSDLNTEVKNGKLKVESNLEIVVLEPLAAEESGDYTTLVSCPGKNTSLAYHWWGVSRYLNYCNANKFAADMASVAAGYTGAGLVAGIWFPGVAVAGGIIASYAALMSARVSANNNGSGVYIGITYAGFFNVEPQ
ncbi:hypothetical protein [Cytobacillus sp. NCCP-133]|uniref:hypothetical protein n=1 Tax=Cytobacillus sp. NCCP-133 TaxID=766848 RepID=UPI0022304EEA|nr:hypothetical protein [Cytobacillus sp. NCCP-133]GLB62107.1 hypothetical protein NCCP133_42360 [Cytobacillus sp. NCCP-133]